MHISDIMTADPVTIEAGASIDRALELMDRHGVHHLPVLQDGVLAGILSDRDVLEHTGGHRRGQGEPDASVRAWMRVPVETVKADVDVNTAALLLSQARIGCAPVVERGRVIGIVTETDVLRAFVQISGRGQAGGGDGTLVREAMSAPLVRAQLSIPLGRARDLMREHRIRHLPLWNGQEPVAILSDRDVRRALGLGRDESASVAGVPREQELALIEAGEPLLHAAVLLADHASSALLVVEDGKPVGIVTLTDVLDHAARLPWRAAQG